MTPAEALDRILLLLVSGLSREAVQAAAVAKLGLDPGQADAAIADARRRLTIAAQYHHDEQLGVAITRLNGIFAAATGFQDHKTALGAQRELNRLLGLYGPPPTVASGLDDLSPDAAELASVRDHLGPVLVGVGRIPSAGVALTATAELARLAAVQILQLAGARP